MRAVLVGSMPVAQADLASYSQAGGTAVYAIDGGLTHCVRAGLKPALAIGDWDSFDEGNLSLSGRELFQVWKSEGAGTENSVRWITLSPDKDMSDLSAALTELRADSKIESVIGFGFSGGRSDHWLSNLLEISNQISKWPRALSQFELKGLREDVYFLSGKNLPTLKLKMESGQLFSVFSLNGPSIGVNLKGAKYELNQARLEPGSLGLSNEALNETLSVSLAEGSLVVIVQREFI